MVSETQIGAQLRTENTHHRQIAPTFRWGNFAIGENFVIVVSKEIDETILIYDRIRTYKYRVRVIDLDLTFELTFSPKHYHHLVGFHHLLDQKTISTPISTDRFYRDIRNGRVRKERIVRSSFYESIKDRIVNFYRIEEMLNNRELQIVVEFDRAKAGSEIDAKFYLYQREGNPLIGEPVTYYNLFIGKDNNTGRYYPATFVVEHSRLYANGQSFHDCVITVVDQESGQS